MNGATHIFLGGRKTDAPTPPWLASRQTDALARFEKEGVPSTKLEAWRYTDLKRLTEGPVLQHLQTPRAQHTLAPSLFDRNDAAVLTLQDGVCVPSLCRDINALGKGVLAGGLREALASHPNVCEPHLSHGEPMPGEALATLNAACFTDGAVLFVPAKTELRRPVVVRYVATGGAGTITYPRLLVVLEEGSAACLVEEFVGGEGADGYVNNAVAEIVLGRGARLEHVRVQDEAPKAFHFAALEARLAAQSEYRLHHVALGAGFARYTTAVRLLGERAETALSGLVVATGDEHHDHVVLVEHRAGLCKSSQLFKNVLDANATTVFNGKIHVRANAQQSDAAQRNQNLLLSNTATANTRPQLEIDANDVRCAHGATVGQLDPDQVFYLRSRGFSVEDARRELTLGFAREVTQNIKPVGVAEIAEMIDLRVAQKLTASRTQEVPRGK